MLNWKVKLIRFAPAALIVISAIGGIGGFLTRASW